VSKAVVLLSGGLDSSTVLALAREDGHELYALSIGYGQRHARELAAARALAAHFGCREHRELALDPRGFTGSALTDAGAPLPLDRGADEMGAGVPLTYVPARNLTFLALATGYAEVVGADNIYLGINALDYSVSGDAKIWVRGSNWARLMTLSSFYALSDGHYETMAADRDTLQVAWRRVTGRFRHDSLSKRCFEIVLERGQHIHITEDHSLFTIDERTASLKPVRGRDIAVGMPIVTPFDLSSCAHAWSDDLLSLDLSEMPVTREGRTRKSSITRVGAYYVNRLGRSKVPALFPVSDDFLYVIGLWLAEGGKSPTTESSTLAFSIGGIPGAAQTLESFFAGYGVNTHKSPQNNFD
jgi:queuosine biosynthesis protein QueC